MSTRPEEPLDPSLVSIVRALRDELPVPAASLSRVWDRVETAPQVSLERSSGLAAHAKSAVALAFTVGAVAGAALHAAVAEHPRKEVVYVDRPVQAPPMATPAPPEPSAVDVPRPPPRAPSARSTKPAAAAPSHSLADEQAVIDAAQVAIGRGEAERALALLAEHARRFPKGQLSEERDALSVQALVTLGRYDEARAAAARLRAASPDSVFLPSVEASLQSIP